MSSMHRLCRPLQRRDHRDSGSGFVPTYFPLCSPRRAAETGLFPFVPLVPVSSP